MLTDTEVAFLRERLDEDEAAAKAAPGDSWEACADGCCVIDVAERCEGDSAAHIARHDPARALREVAVWRKLLLEYHSAPLDAVYGGTERETGFRLALSAALKAKIATYDGNPVTGEPFPSGQARG